MSKFELLQLCSSLIVHKDPFFREIGDPDPLHLEFSHQSKTIISKYAQDVANGAPCFHPCHHNDVGQLKVGDYIMINSQRRGGLAKISRIGIGIKKFLIEAQDIENDQTFYLENGEQFTIVHSLRQSNTSTCSRANDGAQFVPQMPSLKRRLELIKGDISQNTALLEPIAGPSNTKRTRICPKCEQVFDEVKVLNHGCDLFECDDQDCYKLFKSKKNLRDHKSNTAKVTCQICGKQIAKNYLKRHLQFQHK